MRGLWRRTKLAALDVSACLHKICDHVICDSISGFVSITCKKRNTNIKNVVGRTKAQTPFLSYSKSTVLHQIRRTPGSIIGESV